MFKIWSRIIGGLGILASNYFVSEQDFNDLAKELEEMTLNQEVGDIIWNHLFLISSYLSDKLKKSKIYQELWVRILKKSEDISWRLLTLSS